MSETDSTSRRRPPTIDLTAKEVETARPEAKPQPDAESASTDAKPESVGEAYWQLHHQSRDAWTHELDLRPFRETW